MLRSAAQCRFHVHDTRPDPQRHQLMLVTPFAWSGNSADLGHFLGDGLTDR